MIYIILFLVILFLCFGILYGIEKIWHPTFDLIKEGHKFILLLWYTTKNNQRHYKKLFTLKNF